ncbi:MAG: hypothetical protein P4L92_22990 [Rudaea sp.]|nr:hypothetical protein [Rudaea sp.]
MFLLLIVIIVLLSVALFILFHHHMVNLTAWHTFLAGELTTAKNDYAKLRQYVTDHVHLHTAPPLAAVGDSKAKK